MNVLRGGARAWLMIFLLNTITVFFVNIKCQSPKAVVGNSIEYNLVLHKALSMQLECDSMISELLLTKALIREVNTESGRKKLKASLVETEMILSQKQKAVDELFAKSVELNRQAKKQKLNGVEESVVLANNVNGLIVYTYRPRIKLTENDKVVITANGAIVNDSINKNVTRFVVFPVSPYSSSFPIPENEDIPAGLIYRIQLGVFGTKQPDNSFRGLSPLSSEKIEKQEYTKYFVGYFVSLKEARAALEEVKGLGFEDAFVVPYFEKAKISINMARELEFGQKLNTN